MTMVERPHSLVGKSRFEVRVGHARVTVEAETREQALVAARRQLAEEMPRMWDKIYSLEENRFEIEEKR
jgi:hypothetical protein